MSENACLPEKKNSILTCFQRIILIHQAESYESGNGDGGRFCSIEWCSKEFELRFKSNGEDLCF